MKDLYRLIYLLLALSTAMIGYQIHHSLFWSVMDFIFFPVTWCKWLICHQVSISTIRAAFAFFLN